MLKEAEIRTFVEGATNYFEISAQQSATVGSPYLVTDGNPGAYEYTGVIGISGTPQGHRLFYRAARHAYGAADAHAGDRHQRRRTSRISSAKWRIRSPATRGAISAVNLLSPYPSCMSAQALKKNKWTARAPYVIPINWRTHSAKLVVCLE